MSDPYNIVEQLKAHVEDYEKLNEEYIKLLQKYNNLLFNRPPTREIVVGTYQYGREHPDHGYRYSSSACGSLIRGTNSWDERIEQLDYDNVKFEVVLREKE